jgi:hypothetical protein
MLKHIVLFKLKSDNLTEDVAKAKEMLEALTDKIPELLSMKVYVDNVNDQNYDFALDSEFKNEEDLKIYANHPEHLKVVSFLKPMIEGRACVDTKF